MKSAPKHPQENERLASLESLNILDTLPEAAFDEITMLASQICETPIALVSLVDEKRQWFKSRRGLDATETSRDFAFCAHAILEDKTFIIPDSSKDERFHDNPLAMGGPHVVFYAGAPLLSPDGYPIGTICVIDRKPKKLSASQELALRYLSNQITRLLELRTQLSQQEKMNSKLEFKKVAIENSSEGVVLQSADFRIVDFNQAALEILGLSADQLTGKTSMDPDWHAIREDGSPFPGEQHPAILTLKTGEKQKAIVMGVAAKNKELRWIQINSAPIFKEGSQQATYSVTSFSDITKIKSLENERQMLAAKIVDSAKMTVLGEMAGGIAHEINTPLAVINTKTSLLMEDVKNNALSPENLIVQLGKIKTTAERISKIVKGLSLFSRNSAGDQHVEISLSDVIESTLDLCQEKIAFSQTSLEIKIAEDLLVDGKSAELSQVMMNLIGNAIDAVQNLSEKWIKVSVAKAEGKALISVCDSGNGIPVEILDKIMNPFFTTKEVGKGTGLGLSISRGIVTSHGGKLYYDKNSKNTCFVMELPLSSGQKKVVPA